MTSLQSCVEVSAVLARESPATAADDVMMLNALELPASDEPQVLRRGVELGIELKQHLFDTFYHAVAKSRWRSYHCRSALSPRSTNERANYGFDGLEIALLE